MAGDDRTLKNPREPDRRKKRRGCNDDKGGNCECEGRLVNSDLESETRRPVILPRQHRFTRLVIEECHQRVHHSGVRATLAELRSRYWVPRGRQVVKRILSECVTCRRFTGKPYSTPPTAALSGVKEAASFSRVGVDFAGPLLPTRLLNQTMPLISIIALQDLSISALG